MAKFKVLYMNLAPEDVYKIIRSQLPEGFELITLGKEDDLERKEKIRDVDFVLTATAKFTEDIMREATKLKLIQHQGVGYDTTDVDAARRMGIPIGLTPEGTHIGVAEHTILLILSVYKKIVVAHQSIVRGEWLPFALRPESFEMYGKTLGLIGFGNIGREVARRAGVFGVRMLYHDKYAKVSDQKKKGYGVEEASFEGVLRESDIVSLHVPLTGETRGMMNQEAFGLMKPNAILINTARGNLVKEQDLYEALRDRKIAGAGLDVFEKEPPAPDNPLFKLDNVILTPHISAGTKDALITKMRAAFANMVRVTKGEKPINLVPY